MRYNNAVKTAAIPSIRVRPELRAEVEALLGEGESLSEFVESSVMESVRRRRNQVEFVVRGITSLENAKLTDNYVDPEVLVKRLERKLAVAKDGLSKVKAQRPR